MLNPRRSHELIALVLGLIVTLSSSPAVATGDPQDGQETVNARVRCILGQNETIEIALKNAGVVAPDLANVNSTLTDPDLSDTLAAVIEMQLHANPGLSLPLLKERAAEKSLQLLRMIAKNNGLSLGQDDRKFVDYLVSRSYVTFHLSHRERTSNGDDAANSDRSPAGRRSVSPVSRRGAEGTDKAPSEGTPSNLPRDMSPNPNAGAPSTTSPGQGSGSGSGGQSDVSSEDIINETIEEKLVANLQKADRRIVQLLEINGKVVDEDVRRARLEGYVKKSPEVDAGTFLEVLGGLAGEEVTSFDKLSEGDRKMILGIIEKIASGTVAPPPKDDVRKEQVGQEIRGGVIEIAWEFVPGLSLFDPLTDEVIEVGMPLIGRWRPFDRCFAGRGMIRSRSSREVYLIYP